MGWQSRAKAVAAIADGLARLRGDGIVEYMSHPDRALRSSAPVYSPGGGVTWPADLVVRHATEIEMGHEDTHDTGFGLARYPMPCSGGTVRFPALMKAGAGL